MVAPSRQLLEAGCMKSKQKDRADDQKRFGMGREILSTHPSGRKTSAARLRTHFNTQVGCTIETEFGIVTTHRN